ncbi:PEX5 [Brettanomyces bruxellensis]|uniref:Peroxisomal targeting signal receptor n=1 Tax=Dekkera bruxellensis TaxID=5007 RepID=A0A7D9GYE2_DEKBR|nr:PEX5 [Brettanomyces bruxellensis]
MSFLGGSDCSVNGNALAQFGKRAAGDQSIQQGVRQSAPLGNKLERGNGIRRVNTIDSGDKTQMNKFIGGDLTSGHPLGTFDMRPIGQELQKINQSNGKLHFRERTNNMSILSAGARAAGDRNGALWSSEFSGQEQQKMKRQQMPQMQYEGTEAQQSRNYRMGSLPLGMSYGMPYQGMMPFSANTLHQGTSLAENTEKTELKQNQQSMQNWEESFKEVESEVNTEKIAEGDKNLEEETLAEKAEEAQKEEIGANQNQEDEAAAAWQADFERYASGRENYGEYQFAQKNRYLNQEGAYEIGCKLLEGGARLSEAALAFEAAVQQNSMHTDAWLKLGQVQTQNEKEQAGIAALEKCLELSPQNLQALMTLAISYVNEGYDNAAYATLERWIETKYPTVVSQARINDKDINSDDRYTLNKRITKLFLKAAQISPQGANIDADVQTGLGVLFYSLEEYDKTLDCFRAAIKCDPNNALSWNRLGASLANSNRPEQAIEAYTRALQLNPNFVRARYNLGVSFINMGMYKDAVDHLLTGLSLHEVEGPDGNGSYLNDDVQPTSLMETLKRAFLAMNRRDLLDEVKPGMRVEEFRKKYNF